MAGESVGQIGLDLVVNKNNFESQMKGIGSLAKKAGAALAGAFAIKKIVDFGKECVELGSNLSEVQNVVDVTFPNMTKQVNEFAKNAASQFGLSETMAKKFTGTFGAMAKAFGFSEKEAYKMGSALTGLSGDVASFYNISQEEAYTKLKSVFTGETESLKDLGIVMTQSALDAFALSNGFSKVTQKMSEGEKVALRYAFVQEQLALASGDFARTSGGWANQVRILNLQFDSLKATIGQGLINLFTPIIKGINVLLGKLATLANAFKAFTELITGNKSSGSSGISDTANSAMETAEGLENASSAAGNLADNTKAAGKEAKKAAKDMKQLSGFDKLNNITTSNSGGSGGTGTAGNAVDYGKLADGKTVIDDVSKKFSKMAEDIMKLAKPTTDALKRLWDEGLRKLGDFTWDTLKDFWNNFLKPMATWFIGDDAGLPKFLEITNDILNTIDWGKLQSSLADLYISLQDIVKFKWTAQMDFYENFLKPLSVWTMSEALPRLIDCFTKFNNDVNWSSINTSLNDLWKELEPFAKNIGKGLLWFFENVLTPFSTWVANKVVPRFLTTLTDAITSFNEIIEALKPLFLWFWDELLSPIANWTAGIFLSIWDSINDALSIFSTWCAENPGIISGITIAVAGFFAAWKVIELLSFIQQSGGVIAALGGIATALYTTIAAKIADKAETMALTAIYAKDFVVGLAKGTAELVKQAAKFVISTAAKIADTAAQVAMTAATLLWNAACTIATTLTTAFGVAIAFLTSPIGLVVLAITGLIAIGVLLYKNWDVVKAKATEIWGKVKQIFEKFDTFLQNVFKKDFTRDFGAIGDVLNAFSKNAKDIWDAVKKIFGGITTFVSGVFTGDWEKAWNGVKKIFKGVFDGLVAIAKAPINLIIGLINGMISGIETGINKIVGGVNKLSFTTPDWLPGGLGGKKFGFDLKTVDLGKIKYLAQGGYVKKNTPQLAMIGDNRHQGEVVAPEDKLRHLLDEAVTASSKDTDISALLILLKQIIDLLKAIYGKEYMAYVKDSEVFSSVKKNAANYKKVTGRPVFE